MHKLPLIAPVLLALAAAPVADAKKPRAATFELEVTGSQVTTWEYQKQQAASCDWPEEARGDQEIKFNTPRATKTRVKVVPGPRGGVTITPQPILALADAEMQRDWASYYSRQSPCSGGGTYGGGGGPAQDARGTEKCGVLGGVNLRLGATRSSIYNAGDPLRPAREPGGKGNLLLRGEPLWNENDSWHSLPSQCERLDQPGADIGITSGRGEWGGGLVETSMKLPARKLLDGRRKLKVSGSETVRYPNAVQTEPGPPRTTGKTILAVNLTFKRVGR